jgi:hypothetical protein
MENYDKTISDKGNGQKKNKFKLLTQTTNDNTPRVDL